MTRLHCPSCRQFIDTDDPMGFESLGSKCPRCGFWPSEPDLWGNISYPTEFEMWRANHKHHKDPGGVIPRCPRCFSTKVKKDGTYIRCLGCRYSEFLVDYPTA